MINGAAQQDLSQPEVFTSSRNFRLECGPFKNNDSILNLRLHQGHNHAKPSHNAGLGGSFHEPSLPTMEVLSANEEPY